MGSGYRCTHYELLPCDRELQILSHNSASSGTFCFSKARSGANPALKGKPAQVSTVRTEKLVFSLNYDRVREPR